MARRLSANLKRIVFVIPLVILVVERLAATLQYLWEQQHHHWSHAISGSEMEEWMMQQPPKEEKPQPPPRAVATKQQPQKRPRGGRLTPQELARSHEVNVNCPKDFLAIVDHPHSTTLPISNDEKHRKIPKIVHQTSKSRCVTSSMASLAQSWRLLDDDNDNDPTSSSWAYYFYDDAALERLFFDQEWPEFPQLSLILRSCATTGTLRADVARYLLLYEYGGIYADLDSKPNLFNATSIHPTTDDGFFVVEQYHILSQYFMAVSPRHPLMYYAVQECLLHLMEQVDIHRIHAPFVTGPHALHHAFVHFMRDGGVTVPTKVIGNKCVRAGVWVGTNNRSITVVGRGEYEREYVFREAIKRFRKEREYEKMGMTHFTKQTGTSTDKVVSCLAAMQQQQQQQQQRR